MCVCACVFVQITVRIFQLSNFENVCCNGHGSDNPDRAQRDSVKLGFASERVKPCTPMGIFVHSFIFYPLVL